MKQREDGALNLFISCAPEDAQLRESLLRHLAVLFRFRDIRYWGAEMALPGADLQLEAERALDHADLALLLLSADSLASNFIQDVELPGLVERHRRRGLLVVPIVMRTCAWQHHPWLSGLSPLPRSGRAVAAYDADSRDQVLTEVVEQIAALARQETEPASRSVSLSPHLESASPLMSSGGGEALAYGALGKTSTKIFLSHNAANKDFVKKVAVALRRLGLSPWLDIWEMAPGDLLLPTLERAIHTCDCFILFWSNESKTAPWVEWERRNADSVGGKRRICVRLEEIVPPPELSQRIWLDWITWKDNSTFEGNLQRLVRSIYGKPQEDPPTSRPSATLHPRIVEPTATLLEEMFSRLVRHYGPQNWWVRDNKLQLCLEAILSQGTSWRNVKSAIDNLLVEDALSVGALVRMPVEHLRILVRPCGRAKSKADYIKNFVTLLEQHYHSNIEELLAQETSSLRKMLLTVKGIGEFTCDNILLYAAQRTKLPINDRVRKVLFEHDLIDELDTYDTAQRRIERSLPFDAPRLQELDAMLYHTTRDYCGPIPQCDACPLSGLLSERGPRSRRGET